MRLSRNYCVEDWAALKFQSEADWELAVSIFLDRVETRYLEHIRALLSRKTNGFVVLALDSALIETLEQFRRGVGKTPMRKGCEYFESFLTGTKFGEYFTSELAEIFYREIRCGLLHQTEAGGSSRVKRGEGLAVVTPTADGRGVIINTPKFHQVLEDEVQSYAEIVRSGLDVPSRQAFRRKMNYICRIESEEPANGIAN